MNSLSTSSPSIVSFPDEVNLNILSFLGKRDLQTVACTCHAFENLAKDFQTWKPRAESEFGKFVANGAKQPNKSWKQTYEELEASRKTRTENIPKVLQTHVKKRETDDIQYRTSTATAALFGFAMPTSNTHNVPTGQTGYLGTRKITVYKTIQK